MRQPLKILLVTHQRRSHMTAREFPWARGLAARGHIVDVMCHADVERWKTVAGEHDGYRIINSPDLLVGALRQGWDPICAIRRGVWLFRQRSAYDIIHCLGTRPAVILPCLTYARAKGIRIVSDWVDWWGRGGLIKENRPLWYRAAFGGFETFFEEYFRDKLDGLTTISAALLERGVKLGVSPERCLRIPGGADLATFSDVPSKEESRKALGIPPAAAVVCYSGLDVLGDLPLAVHAFARIAAARPDAIFLLVGPPPALIRTLAAHRFADDRIVCTGRVAHADLAKYLAAADVFLMPYADRVSNVGRWPNKIGDFMCVGRPTVSNPVGEVKWLFEQFEIGTLAAPTADSMADAALALLNDPERAETLGRQARTTAATVFSWEHLIEGLERWYYKILSMPLAHAEQQDRRQALARTR